VRDAAAARAALARRDRAEAEGLIAASIAGLDRREALAGTAPVVPLPPIAGPAVEVGPVPGATLAPPSLPPPGRARRPCDWPPHGGAVGPAMPYRSLFRLRAPMCAPHKQTGPIWCPDDRPVTAVPGGRGPAQSGPSGPFAQQTHRNPEST
jgi:hypothetical protein